MNLWALIPPDILLGGLTFVTNIAQIEPHFLFNTLANTIGLITTAPNQAIHMLENLTSLLRVSLKRTRGTKTTLGEELAILEAYLAIQKIRLGRRLRYTITDNPAFHQAELAPLLLQPLVENAVMHGIEPSPDGGLVKIDISRGKEGLNITISNTGASFEPTANSTPGYGLKNVEERIAALYGDKAKLMITQETCDSSSDPDKLTNEGGQLAINLTKVVLVIPNPHISHDESSVIETIDQ